MKKKKSLIALAVAAVCSMLFFTACKPHHPKGTFALDYLTEVLDLTESQEKNLESIRSEIMDKVEAMHSDKKEMHAVLKEQLAAEQIDKQVIKQLISEHRNNMGEVINLAVDRLTVFHEELTPEQREKLVAKFEKFEKHHHGRFHN